MKITFLVIEQNVSVICIDINAISLFLDLNIFQQDECFCSKLRMEVENAKSNFKTSLSQIWVNRHLLPFLRVGHNYYYWGWYIALSIGPRDTLNRDESYLVLILIDRGTWSRSRSMWTSLLWWGNRSWYWSLRSGRSRGLRGLVSLLPRNVEKNEPEQDLDGPKNIDLK